MTSKTHFARLMASLVVLCTAVLFAQDAHAAEPPVKGTETTSKCPVMAEMKDSTLKPTAAGAYSNGDWWPDQLNLKILDQNSSLVTPMGKNFNYSEEFKSSTLLLSRRISML